MNLGPSLMSYTKINLISITPKFKSEKIKLFVKLRYARIYSVGYKKH
jgi:hypothetical protein